jgi:hypothetical protein
LLLNLEVYGLLKRRPVLNALGMLNAVVGGCIYQAISKRVLAEKKSPDGERLSGERGPRRLAPKRWSNRSEEVRT